MDVQTDADQGPPTSRYSELMVCITKEPFVYEVSLVAFWGWTKLCR